MTVTLAEVPPPAPEAVIVNVVLSSGDTILDPFGATLPMFGSMEQLSAWVEVQVRTLDSPALINGGLAEMFTNAGGVVSFFATATRIEAPRAPRRQTKIRLRDRSMTSL